MDHFENLTPEESHQLMSAPAYISLLAATHDGEMDDTEKKAAIKLTHLKTFSSDEFLNSFYKEVETNFTTLIDNVYHTLPNDAAEREITLRNNLHHIDSIVAKLPMEYGQKLKHSLESYSWHVSQSHKNVSEDFLIPLKIRGLTA